jgi:hypothetical protein
MSQIYHDRKDFVSHEYEEATHGGWLEILGDERPKTHRTTPNGKTNTGANADEHT